MWKQKLSKINKIAILLFLVPIFTSGCFGLPSSLSSGGAKKSVTTGGMFRSDDKGEAWQRVTTLYTIGNETKNFNAANITTIAFDPLDEKALYVGTQTDGVFYSFNYGEGWFNTLAGFGTVNDIAVDPRSNCVVYVAIHNSIFKTIDCSRKWERIYFETRPNQFITSLVIDYKKTNIVYAGTSDGGFLKSQDSGHSWDVLKRFPNYISDIIIQNQLDDNIIYVVTQQKGIFKTTDAGETWMDLMEVLVDRQEINEEAVFNLAVEAKKKELKVSQLPEAEMVKLTTQKYRQLKSIDRASVLMSISSDLSVKDGIIFANPVGIFRLTDGKMWKQLSLLTPPGKDNIYSVVVNPQDTKEILYGTANAWYRTVDGGENWVIKPLPTNFTAKIMSFSPDQKYLYLGAYNISKK